MRRKKISPKKNFSQFFGEKIFFSRLTKSRFPTWDFFATQHDFSTIPIGQLSKIKKAYLGFVLEKSKALLAAEYEKKLIWPFLTFFE